MEKATRKEDFEVKVKELVIYFRKYALFSLKSISRFACRHPFVASFSVLLFILYSCFPSIFAFLVSSSPVLSCTALLLGILLSYGEPNIPEIEEDYKITREVSCLKVEKTVNELLLKKDESYTIENLADSRIRTEERISKNSVPDSENERASDFLPLSSLVHEHNLEHGLEKNLEVLMREQLESYTRTGKVADDANEEIEGHKEPELDNWLDSSLGSPWKPLNMHDTPSDSESDQAESSSSDASMSDIRPMLDELHPLLDSETPHHAPKSAYNSDSDISSHHESDEDSAEQEDECKIEEKDESNKFVMWTADDKKNVMDLGSSDLERNQRLENLIARRRARKNQIIIFENDLIDLHTNDTKMDELFRSHRIPPISAPRRNFFDPPYDLNESKGLPPIPGSAPSVLPSGQNPFYFLRDSEDSSKGLFGESLCQPEFGSPSQRSNVLRRYDSFASRSSFPTILMHEKPGFSRLNPKFVTERVDSGDNVDFDTQLRGINSTKSSFASSSGTISSAFGPMDQMMFTEQEAHEGIAISATEQDIQLYKDGSVDPNASEIIEEAYQGIDDVKNAVEKVKCDFPILDEPNHEVVLEKHDGFTLLSSSEKNEKSLDISLHEEQETQEHTTSVSKEFSEFILSVNSNASHMICETDGVNSNKAAVSIHDSIPSESESFYTNISVPVESLLSSGRGNLHPVSSELLVGSLTSDEIEFKTVDENKLQESISSCGDTVIFSRYRNLLDENMLASKGASETGEQIFYEDRSTRFDEDYRDLGTSLKIDLSSSLSSLEVEDDPSFAFSVGFPSSKEENHQSMEELEMQSSFGTYHEVPHFTNLKLGPVLEKNSEDFKVEELDASISHVGQKVMPFHDQSVESQHAGNEGLDCSPETAKSSMTSNLVSFNDDMLSGLVIEKLADSIEISYQDGLNNEFQINQDVTLGNLNDFHSNHEDVDAEVEEMQFIVEKLLSELDMVGDFQAGELTSKECLNVDSQSANHFDCSGEASEIRSAHVHELNDPDEIDLVLNQDEPKDSGYWFWATAPVEDLTVYKPKVHVLEAYSLEELALAETSLSEASTGKLAAENPNVGLSGFDMFDREVEEITRDSMLLSVPGKNAEDISFNIAASPYIDLQSNDIHFSLDCCKSDRSDSAEIQTMDAKADFCESVMPSTSQLTSSCELYISSRDFKMEETDSELLVLEAKSIEDIHSAFKLVTEIAVEKNCSNLVNSEPMMFHPVDDAVESLSLDVEKTSDLLVVEANSLEVISSAFRQVTEEGFTASVFRFSDPVPVTTCSDFEVIESRFLDAENSKELLVFESRSAEEVSSMPTSQLDDVSSMPNQDLEVVGALIPETYSHADYLATEGSFSVIVDSTSEPVVVDLDKFNIEKIMTNSVHELEDLVNSKNDTESLVFPVSLGNTIDDEAADEKALHTQIDSELLVLDSKNNADIDSSLESSFERELLRSTFFQIDPDHDSVKDESLQTSSNSELLVLESESVEETISTSKRVTEGVLDMSSPSFDHEAAFSDAYAGVHKGSSSTSGFEVEDNAYFKSENNSEMLFVEAKSLNDINSAFKQTFGVSQLDSKLLDVQNASNSLLLKAESVELDDSTLNKVHHECSNISASFTSPTLQINFDDDFMEERSLRKGGFEQLAFKEKTVEDIDSTYTQLVNLQDDSKLTDTLTLLENKNSVLPIPEPEPVSDCNAVSEQVIEEGGSPESTNEEVKCAKETIAAFDAPVTGENSSGEDQINTSMKKSEESDSSSSSSDSE